MSEAKKILIVCESIDIEDSSGSKANVALIKNLNIIGYDIVVYHYTRKEINLDDIACFSLNENRKGGLFLLSRIERYLRYLLKVHLNKPLENLFGFSFTLLNDRNSIVHGLKKNLDFEPDLVITLSKGGSFRPHHALLKIPDWHCKWMAYIHDPYPMHWYPPPYPWFEPGYRQKQDFMEMVASKCKFAVFPSKILMQWMGTKNRNFEEKGVIIPHQLEETDIPDRDISNFLDPEQFNIIHAGNLIQGREPYGLILGFQKFLQNNPEAGMDARLILIGGANYYSSELEYFETEIKQLILSDGKMSFEFVQNIQSKSAVNVILEAKSSISPFLPGKFPHCIKANKPILFLGPKYSETIRLLGDDYKYSSEIDDENRIADLMSRLYNEWKEDRKNFKLNRPDLKRYLSKDELRITMKEIFKSMRN